MNAAPPNRFTAGQPWRAAALATAVLCLQACTSPMQTPPTAEIASEAGVLLESSAGVPELEVQSPVTSESSALVPVYWLGKDNGMLYREFLSTDSSGDPIAESILAMTSAEPIDTDYYTPWQPASSVSTSISPDNVITVDLSSDAFGSALKPDVAGRAVQQLVYTATAAAANAGLIASGSPSSVRLLVDGKAGYEAFGHVGLGAVLQRDVRALAPVWITNPQDGSIPSGRTVILQGGATSPVSSLAWHVRRVDGVGDPTGDILSGFVPVESVAGSIGLFEFSVTLDPGTYLLEVTDASGQPSGSDDKLLSIR